MMAHDTDSFNRWNAGNTLYSKLILKFTELSESELYKEELPATLVDAVREILNTCRSGESDASLTAYSLQLPDMTTLSLEMPVIHVENLLAARKFVKKKLVELLKVKLVDD